MKYLMLGRDESTTAERLEKYNATVPWSYLAPHLEKGTLYYVDPSLPLQDVGAAISNDDTGRIGALLKLGNLVKLEAIHAAQWTNSAAEFEALVVSPFVLCRPA